MILITLPMNASQLNNNTTDWWTTRNSRIIWLLVLGLFILTILTSVKNKSNSLGSFGTNQLIIIAFMTFLLLFRSISKIKIGNIAEVETREAIRVSLNSLTKTLEAIDYTIKPLPSELTDNKNIGNAKDQLSEANEGIKAARDLLRNQD